MLTGFFPECINPIELLKLTVTYIKTYLSSCLFRFNAKKPMAIFRRSINVTKCATVRHVLGYKTDLVNRVMVQTILENKNKKLLFGFITRKPGQWQLMQNGAFFASYLILMYLHV